MNIRVNRKSYTTLSNYPIIDRNLSAISLGIFTYIMSKPDGWKAHKNEIYKRFSDASITTSKNAIDQAFKELVNIGYVEIKTIVTTNEKGQKIFNGREYVFNEEPKTVSENLPNSEDFGSSEIPDVGYNPTSKKVPHIVNTDFKENTEKEKEKTDLIEKKKYKSSENSTLVFPSEFSPQLIKTLNEFFEYKKEIKKPLKSQKSINALFNKITSDLKEYGEKTVIDSLYFGIANGWQGYYIKTNLNNNQKQNQNGIRTIESEQEIRLRSSANIAQGFLNQINEEERRRNNLEQYLSELEKSKRR